jgi:hypothetical protein
MVTSVLKKCKVFQPEALPSGLIAGFIPSATSSQSVNTSNSHSLAEVTESTESDAPEFRMGGFETANSATDSSGVMAKTYPKYTVASTGGRRGTQVRNSESLNICVRCVGSAVTDYTFAGHRRYQSKQAYGMPRCFRNSQECHQKLLEDDIY